MGPAILEKFHAPARCVPPGSALAVSLQASTARQSSTAVPRRAQSWRYAGNTPTSCLLAGSHPSRMQS
uniref:Uncharacterized protein n=1 Tax=Meleagris gallopavo TaxID=9103 RepID=A0A803YLB3_MELGA